MNLVEDETCLQQSATTIDFYCKSVHGKVKEKKNLYLDECTFKHQFNTMWHDTQFDLFKRVFPMK